MLLRPLLNVLLLICALPLAGEILILPPPASSSAASSKNSDVFMWGSANLYDKRPSAAAFNSLWAPGLERQYAPFQEQGDSVIVYQFGAPVSFNGLAFQASNVEGVALPSKIEIWVTNTDPGPASNSLPQLARSPDGSTDDFFPIQLIRNYELNASLTGQWVIIRLTRISPMDSPGGSELHLTIDTDMLDPYLQVDDQVEVGPIVSGVTRVEARIPISNLGAEKNLTISGVTINGASKDQFKLVSLPDGMAPGAEDDILIEFTPRCGFESTSVQLVISSNQEFLGDRTVTLTMLPAEPVFLPDPVSATASSSFDERYIPDNLYDSVALPALLNDSFPHASIKQFAGSGSGPHIVVLDYGQMVSFNGLAYSQRPGDDELIDKVTEIEVWVSATDPGVAGTSMPILSDPVDATTGQLELAGTNFRHHDLGRTLSGRWVVLRLNDGGPGSANPGGSALQLTYTPHGDPILDIAPEVGGSEILLNWVSRPGKSYLLRSGVDLSNTGAFTDIHGHVSSGIVETKLLRYPREESEAVRFFLLDELEVPAVFFDDFENGQGGWTTSLERSRWELGSPSAVGPLAAASPNNCFGTGIASIYAPLTRAFLFSPAINLTGTTSATLHFLQYLESERRDFGSIMILNAGNGEWIATLDDNVEGEAEWAEASYPIPASALGKFIKLQFLFQANSFDEFPGWYIDDVKVTSP